MGTLSDWVRKGKRAIKKNKKSLTHAALAGGAYFAAPYVLGSGAAAGASGAANAAGGAAAGGAAAGGAAAGSGGFWSGVGSAFGQGLGYAGAGIAANAGLDLYNRISGKPTNPYEQGQASAAYNAGAYPGTTPWEQLGGQKPQATDAALAREQRTHEAAMQQRQLENAVKIVGLQTEAQKQVAGISADATVRASGQESATSPVAQQAAAALRQANVAELRYNFDKWARTEGLRIEEKRDNQSAKRGVMELLHAVLPKNVFDIPAAQWNRAYSADELNFIGVLTRETLYAIDPAYEYVFQSLQEFDEKYHSNLIPGADRGKPGKAKFSDYQSWMRRSGAAHAHVIGYGLAGERLLKTGFEIFNMYKSAGIPGQTWIGDSALSNMTGEPPSAPGAPATTQPFRLGIDSLGSQFRGLGNPK